MAMGERQRRQALGHAYLPWSPQVVDARATRGRRHGLHGCLNLLVAGFACGKQVLRRVEDLGKDLSRRARKALGLPAKVSDTTLWRLLEGQDAGGFRETLQAQGLRMVSSPACRWVQLPVRALSIDGKSLLRQHER